MREKATEEQFQFDPEIERTLRRLNSKALRRRKLAQEKRQREEASTSSNNQIEEVVVDTFEGDMAGVVPTEMSANSPRRTSQFACNAQGRTNTEMKSEILQLVYANPFTGMDHENPFTHLTKFYEIAGSTGVDAANEESLFKRLFPHSLLGKAKEWYLDQLPNVMTDWNLLEEKYLERYFPQSRFMEAKTAIAVFNQGSNESLNDAWERFKSMLRKCKGHGFDDLTQIHIFQNGLQPVHKTLLDATACGSLMSKSAEDAIMIIDRMALNDLQTQHDRSPSQRKSGVLELNTNDAILAQNKILSQQVELLTKKMSKLPQQMKEIHGMQMTSHVASCELCQGDHPTGFCPPPEGEEVNYVNNQNQGYQRQPSPHNNPYQRNNQGFQPSRFDNHHYQHQSPYQSSNPQGQGQQSQSGSSKLEDTLTQFMQASMANQRSTEAAIKNLENQVGQLAKQLSEQQPGAYFSANTQTNPKEHCKAIFTRSGKEVNSGVNEEVIVEDEEEIIVEDEEEEVTVENEGEKSEEKVEEELVEKERKEKEGREKNDKKVNRNKKRNENVSTIPLQHLPYPHVQSRKEDARRYARFMDIFKQLHINIPFSEALEKMPKYAKFMKKMLTKKKSTRMKRQLCLMLIVVQLFKKLPQERKPTRDESFYRSPLEVTTLVMVWLIWGLASI